MGRPTGVCCNRSPGIISDHDTVTLQADGTLTLLFPGQPLYHVEPQGGLRYAIRELPGFAVAFDRDSAGAISQMDVLQRPPQPNFTAIRVRGAQTP
jgi:hypothetical protein